MINNLVRLFYGLGFSNNKQRSQGNYAIRKKNGCAGRIRADLGTENTYVGNMQLFLRQIQSDEFAGEKGCLCGKNTHNQRIACFWGLLRKEIGQFDLHGHVFELRERSQRFVLWRYVGQAPYSVQSCMCVLKKTILTTCKYKTQCSNDTTIRFLKPKWKFKRGVKAFKPIHRWRRGECFMVHCHKKLYIHLLYIPFLIYHSPPSALD